MGSVGVLCENITGRKYQYTGMRTSGCVCRCMCVGMFVGVCAVTCKR